jgi:opacity protein-like surface antigen
MFKKLSLAALLAIGTLTHAESNSMSKEWEAGLLGVGISEGSNGDRLGNGYGLGARLGYHLNQNVSLVGEILYSNPDYEFAHGDENVDVVDYIAGVNYDFHLNSTFIPFVSLGLGYRTVSDVDGRDDWNVLPGLGMKIPLDKSLQLIVEGKGRFNLEEDEKGFIGTIGVNYLF